MLIGFASGSVDQDWQHGEGHVYLGVRNAKGTSLVECFQWMLDREVGRKIRKFGGEHW